MTWLTGARMALLVSAVITLAVAILITVLQLTGAGVPAELNDTFRLLAGALIASIAVERVATNGK